MGIWPLYTVPRVPMIRPPPPMRLLALFSLLLLPALRADEEKVVIWKLDDVKAGEKSRLAKGFKRVADWAKAEKTVVTMGVICESLTQPNKEDVEWIRQNAVENGGVVEFWLHGWDHRSVADAAGVKTFEFQGPDTATQAKHLKDACALFKKTAGLTFRAFGAPFNQIDAHTPAALDETPELTIWLYGPKVDARRTVLPRSLNMEVATGKVSYAKFIEAYEARPPRGLLLLQGHCGMWDDASFGDFTKIAGFLKQNGWVTRTCAQYADRPARGK